jgi:hypothetical protein
MLRSALLALSLLPLTVAADNCINSTECPVWPQEFSAPFGLYDDSPSIVNASSTFYYKYDEDGTTQAQLVDYTEQCFPLVSLTNARNAIPCQLLFIPDGIYLLQPALDIDCCKWFSTPPPHTHTHTIHIKSPFHDNLSAIFLFRLLIHLFVQLITKQACLFLVSAQYHQNSSPPILSKTQMFQHQTCMATKFRATTGQAPMDSNIGPLIIMTTYIRTGDMIFYSKMAVLV